MYLMDVYAKLAEAEDEIREGRTVDARQALKAVSYTHLIMTTKPNEVSA